MSAKKFATQIDEKVLIELKKFAKQSNRKISGIVNEAIAEFLQRSQVRPEFVNSMNKVLSDNHELLQKLAK